jgi:hypothetical protein
MSQPPSPEYRRFVASVKSPDPAFFESVDEEALLALEKAERRSAEELLMERLDLDDVRAPPALAHATCRGAVMPMKRRLPKASARMRVAIAVALTDLEAIPGPDETVVEVLRSGDIEGGVPALGAAEELRSEEVRLALLWSCVHHPDPVVRCNAGAVLFYAAGVATDPLAWDVRPLWLPLGDEDPGVRKAAFKRVCEVIGVSPDEADDDGLGAAGHDGGGPQTPGAAGHDGAPQAPTG